MRKQCLTWKESHLMSHQRRALHFIRTECAPGPNGCIEYQGKVYMRSGHVQLFFKGSKRWIHRYVYTHLVAPVPSGKQVCHTCDNPKCVNIDHLWVGTQRENSLDMVAKGRQKYMSKTHCKQGHPFSPENTYLWRGKHRKCRTCQRESQRRNYEPTYSSAT